MVVDIFGRSKKRGAGGLPLTESGDYDVSTKRLKNVGHPIDPNDAVNKVYADGRATGLPLTASGQFDMQSRRLSNVGDPVEPNDGVHKHFLESRCLTRAAEGAFDAQSMRLTHVGEPLLGSDALNKKYLTDRIFFEKNYYSFNRKRLVSVADPKDHADVVTLNYLNSHALMPNVEGQFDAKEQKIIKLAEPKPGTNDAVPCSYLEKTALVQLGDTFDARNNRIKNLARPTARSDAVSLEYVQDKALCSNSTENDDGQNELYWEAADLRIKNLADPKEETDAVNEQFMASVLRIALKKAIKTLTIRLRHELADLAIELQRQFYGIKAKKDKDLVERELNSIESSITRNWRSVHGVSAPIKHSREEIEKSNVQPEFLDEQYN